MNSQPNAASGLLNPSPVAPAAPSETRPLYWSVRRELWEYRSIYIAPLAVAGLALVGFLIATIGRALTSPDLVQRRLILAQPYTFATALIMASTFIVAIFYSLEALHAERKDRSILFWKSLPVSDTTTVLSKASIPLVVLPVLTIAITLATQWIMLLLSTLVLIGTGMSPATLWKQLPMFQSGLIYHLITVHVLWHAPVYGWLLLVSGWARRAAFMWAVLPVFALCGLEKIAFNTTYLTALLKYRLSGPEVFDMAEPGRFPMGAMAHHALGTYLTSPGLWLGLIATAIFLAAAAWQRRRQGPI